MADRLDRTRKRFAAMQSRQLLLQLFNVCSERCGANPL